MFSLVLISVQHKHRATWEERTSAEELYQSWPVTMSVVNCLADWYGGTIQPTGRPQLCKKKKKLAYISNEQRPKVPFNTTNLELLIQIYGSR